LLVALPWNAKTLPLWKLIRLKYSPLDTGGHIPAIVGLKHTRDSQRFDADQSALGGSVWTRAFGFCSSGASDCSYACCGVPFMPD
jgi:hypothetical protein